MLSIKKNKHLVNIVVLYFESDLVSFVTKEVEYPPTAEPWIGYIVGYGIFAILFFRDMEYVSSELLGYGILDCHFGYF